MTKWKGDDTKATALPLVGQRPPDAPWKRSKTLATLAAA